MKIRETKGRMRKDWLEKIFRQDQFINTKMYLIIYRQCSGIVAAAAIVSPCLRGEALGASRPASPQRVPSLRSTDRDCHITTFFSRQVPSAESIVHRSHSLLRSFLHHSHAPHCPPTQTFTTEWHSAVQPHLYECLFHVSAKRPQWQDASSFHHTMSLVRRELGPGLCSWHCDARPGCESLACLQANPLLTGTHLGLGNHANRQIPARSEPCARVVVLHPERQKYLGLHAAAGCSQHLISNY